jgi:hypothetical protein
MIKLLMKVIKERLGEWQHMVLQPSPLKKECCPEIEVNAK